MNRLRVFLLALFVPVSAVGQQTVEFSGSTWHLQGEVRQGTHLGRDALLMRSGTAMLDGLEFENGTIEYDVAVTGDRSFLGVAFRVDTATGGYEDFYIRPHQTDRPDAVQYTPVYYGVSAWQLYPEHNSTLHIPRNEWIHIRLDIAGSRMEAFVNESTDPVAVVERLARGRSRGPVVLKAILGAATEEYPSAFSNFSITTNEGPFEYVDERPPNPETGLIGRWEISPAFASSSEPLEELPQELFDDPGWMLAESDSQGRVNLAQYYPLPRGGGTILARIGVYADSDLVKQLNFGFSDRGSVFLNGKLLFTGDNTYLSRSHRYLGVMTIENDALYLSLEQGRNELVFAVSEAFGGWGLIARFADLDGISVETRGR